MARFLCRLTTNPVRQYLYCAESNVGIHLVVDEVKMSGTEEKWSCLLFSDVLFLHSKVCLNIFSLRNKNSSHINSFSAGLIRLDFDGETKERITC
jgi:hypothetical protein